MTRVVVGEFQKGEKNPKVIGIGEYATFGMQHGYIVNSTLAIESLKNAVAMAEKTSGIKIKRAFISINCVTLRGDISSSEEVIIGRADGEITTLDTTKAIENSESNLNLNNRKVIQTYPISYKLDGKEVIGRPEGMSGTRLEVKALFITCSNQHLDDLLGVITDAGIEPIDVIASSIAGSQIVLSEKQKIVGTALVNIGAETVSLAIFENGVLVSLQTFSIGGEDITNDIALGLKIPLEEAENLKLGNNGEIYQKKKLDEIIEARLSDIFELIENNLKKIKRNELLPAGIVFIGGGANIIGLPEFSKNTLKLPSRIGATDLFGNLKTKLRDPVWFNAFGLITASKNNNVYYEGSFSNILKDLKNSIKLSIKQLMP